MKKWLSVSCAVAILGLGVLGQSSYATEKDTVELTGAKLIEGRTLLPLRSIFESLGAKVIWNGKTKTVTAIKDNTKIELTLDSKVALINNESKTLDIPAQLINNSTMVPVRFVGEALNADVDWESKTQTAVITTDNTKLLVSVQDTKKNDLTVVSKIDQAFIDRVKNGYLPTISIPLSSSISSVKETYGNPKNIEQYMEGDYLNYNDLTFLIDESQTVQTISIFGSKIQLTESDLTILGEGEIWAESADYIGKLYKIGNKKVTVYFEPRRMIVTAIHLSN